MFEVRTKCGDRVQSRCNVQSPRTHRMSDLRLLARRVAVGREVSGARGRGGVRLMSPRARRILLSSGLALATTCVLSPLLLWSELWSILLLWSLYIFVISWIAWFVLIVVIGAERRRLEGGWVRIGMRRTGLAVGQLLCVTLILGAWPCRWWYAELASWRGPSDLQLHVAVHAWCVAFGATSGSHSRTAGVYLMFADEPVRGWWFDGKKANPLWFDLTRKASGSETTLSVPLWFVFSLCLLCTIWLWRRDARTWRVALCPNCGYPRHEESSLVTCSECGSKLDSATWKSLAKWVRATHDDHSA